MASKAKLTLPPSNYVEIQRKHERDRIQGRELVLKSYPEAQLPPQVNAPPTHEFIRPITQQFTAQQQSLESTKVLVYAAVAQILSKRSNLPPDAFRQVKMRPDQDIVTYKEFLEASRGSHSDGIEDGEEITLFEVGKYKRIKDLVHHLENGVFPEIEKGGIASLQLLMCLVDERPSNVVELWTFGFKYGSFEDGVPPGPHLVLGFVEEADVPQGPNLVLGMVDKADIGPLYPPEGTQPRYNPYEHLKVDSLVRRVSGLVNNIADLDWLYHPLKPALKYYFYLHYHEGREKGANPAGFEGPPLPVLNFISTFEWGMHKRFGWAANNDSYVKVALGVNMLDASKASLQNSEDDTLGRPLYLAKLNAAEEAKFALYQMEKRGDQLGVLGEDDSEDDRESGRSISSKRLRTTKAQSKRGRTKTADMSSQMKQDRATRAQLRTMNVPSTQATNAGPTQSESGENREQNTPKEHPKIKRNLLRQLRVAATRRNREAMPVLNDDGPKRYHQNSESSFTLLEEMECLCSVNSVGTGDLIRCCYCLMWQHTDCVGFSDAYDIQIPDQYLCTKCWEQHDHLDSEKVTELTGRVFQKQVLGYFLRNEYPIGLPEEVARVVSQSIVGTCTAKEIKEISVEFWNKKIFRKLSHMHNFNKKVTPFYSLNGINNDYGYKTKLPKATLEQERLEAVAQVMEPMRYISHLYTYGVEEEESDSTDYAYGADIDDYGTIGALSVVRRESNESPDYAPQESIEDLPEGEYPPDVEYSSSNVDKNSPEPVLPKRAPCEMGTGDTMEVDTPAVRPAVGPSFPGSKKSTLARDDSLASSRILGALSRPLFLDDTTNTASPTIASSEFEL